MSLRQFSNRPCPSCSPSKDRLFIGMACQSCGHLIVFAPYVEYRHGRPPPVRALTVNERKQRWRAKKARAAKLAQPRSMSSSAQRMRAWRANGAAE